MTTKPDVVFLGPSLPRAQAREIYPDAIFLPPAAVGDVITAAARFKPRAIVLIDGAFLQNLATYHKELLDVMSQGIWVVGSSSMGALRAAECHRYGMIGVGQVFEQFASGETEDDDEVALSHLAEEFDFRPVTEAMVNIRATMAAAVTAGVLRDEEAKRLVDVQKARWFMDRRPFASVADAQEQLGFSDERSHDLQEFIRDHWVDVKAADARLALQRVQQLPETPMPEADRPSAVMSGVYGLMVERDMTVGYEESMPVTRDQIWRYFALNDPRAGRVMNQALLRAATVELMLDAGIELTEEDRQRGVESLARDLGVEPDDLEAHAVQLDMSPTWMRKWIDEEAMVIKLTRWKRLQRMSIGTIEGCLRQLNRMGEYDEVKRAAGLMESLASGSGHYENPLGLRTALKLQAEITSYKLPQDDTELDQFIEDLNLGNRAELYERLATLIAAQREMFDLPPIEIVPADQELEIEAEPQTSRGR